jgi:GH25 family lysozyme M1 (1,4-beta-N-acetylmuramidase)
MKKGIDISFCQTQVRWEQVTADFAIIKAGQRDFTDPMYESHYKGATDRGIPVGAYWYLDALTEEDAKKEADCFIQRLKGKKFAYPVFLDLENEAQFKLGKAKVSALIRTFLTRVEAAGYWVGLYGNLSSLTYYTEDDIKKRYSIWLAQWDVQKPTYNGAYGIWQHSVGKADGVIGACDLDTCYVDYPTQIKAKGLNGYGKEPTPPTPTPKETKEVTLVMDGATWKGTLTKV